VHLERFFCKKLVLTGNWNCHVINPYIWGFTDYGLVIDRDVTSTDIATDHIFWGGEIGYEGADGGQVALIKRLYHATFENMYCEDISKGIHLADYCYNVAFDKFRMLATTDAGDAGDSFVTDDLTNQNLHFTNNHIQAPNAYSAFKIGTFTNFWVGEIINNTIKTIADDANTKAIYLRGWADSSHYTIKNNKILVPTTNGYSIYLSDTDHTIVTGNHVTRPITVAGPLLNTNGVIRDNPGQTNTPDYTCHYVTNASDNSLLTHTLGAVPSSVQILCVSQDKPVTISIDPATLTASNFRIHIFDCNTNTTATTPITPLEVYYIVFR